MWGVCHLPWRAAQDEVVSILDKRRGRRRWGGCVVSSSLKLDLSDCLEYVLVLVMR